MENENTQGTLLCFTVGDLKEALKPFEDECPINKIMLQYENNDGNGKIRIYLCSTFKTPEEK